MNPKPCTTQPRPRGFNCPKCGQPFYTNTTIRSAPNIVTRYRSCETPGCRRRSIVTEERPRRRPAKKRKARPASYR